MFADAVRSYGPQFTRCGENNVDSLTTPATQPVSLSLWEMAARLGIVPRLYFPPPSEIAGALWSSIVRGELGPALWATLMRVIPGLVLGAVPGLLLGVLMGRSRAVRRIADPFIAAVHPIPKIALLPLLMIILGIGEASRIAVVASSPSARRTDSCSSLAKNPV